MAKNCSICMLPLEDEDAAVLAIGAYGTPKCLCKRCEGLIDKASSSRDAAAAEDAIRELGEALTGGNTGDTQVIDTVNAIIKDAAKRAEAIRTGEYDFAADEENNEEEFVIAEDMLETEEDKALDEKEAKTNKIIDTVTAWASGIALVAAVVYFIIKFVL